MHKSAASKKITRKARPPQIKESGGVHSKGNKPRKHREVEFMRALKQEKTRLLAELLKQQVQSQDHPTTGNHMADDATEVEEQAKSLALRSHLEGMAKEIDRALERITKGTYGLCEKCGRPIGDERLAAMPWVTMCIEHAKLAQSPRVRLAA